MLSEVPALAESATVKIVPTVSVPPVAVLAFAPPNSIRAPESTVAVSVLVLVAPSSTVDAPL